ncbi:DUF1643 domain-containing protein [Pseudoalteromonas haloplanktis]|uniref:DUF1643 domain-containing protein n=1 Tax=Pseudoalteromonas haloplanktis TaxID=228 RepID=A0ABU1BKB2_PSEHA|nr:DUF1643 domain-containing protein [Pseudoalteromonas haloplanktis]MDQ9094216.1 DUF1643 domain-containing protein [Pseudoalteromonas haloplanktis]
MLAELSTCRTYRYKLYRDVNMLGDKVIAFFGVNPSTADESTDDATVRKWRGFTERAKGKRFIVGNVFGYRATDVNELAKVRDPAGLENQKHILDVIDEADILVPCWGSRKNLPKELWGNLDNFMSMLLLSGKPVYCFGKTASGDPKHPLILGYNTELVIWE